MYILYILLREEGFDADFLDTLYTLLAEHSVESRQFFWSENFDRYAFAAPSKYYFQVIDVLHRTAGYLLTTFLLVDPTVTDVVTYANRFRVPPTHVLLYQSDTPFVAANYNYCGRQINEPLNWDYIWDLVLEVQLTNTRYYGTEAPDYINPYDSEEDEEYPVEENTDNYNQEDCDAMAYFGPPMSPYGFPMGGVPWVPRGRGQFRGRGRARGQRGGQTAPRTQQPPLTQKPTKSEAMEKKIKALGPAALTMIRNDLRKELKENFTKSLGKVARTGPRLSVARDMATAVVDAAFSCDPTMIKHGNSFIRFTDNHRSQAYANVTLVVPQQIKDDSYYFLAMNKGEKPVYPRSEGSIRTMRCKNSLLVQEDGSDTKKKLAFVAGYTGKAYKLLEGSAATDVKSFEEGMRGIMKAHEFATELGWPNVTVSSNDEVSAVASQCLGPFVMPQYLTSLMPEFAIPADDKHHVAGFSELSVHEDEFLQGPVLKHGAYGAVLVHSGHEEDHGPQEDDQSQGQILTG